MDDTVNVVLDADEWYPVWSMNRLNNNKYNPSSTTIPMVLWERYTKVMKDFDDLQGIMERLSTGKKGETC